MSTEHRSRHLISADLVPLVEQMTARDKSVPLEIRRRERVKALKATLQPHPAVNRSERFIPGPGGNVRILIYEPRDRREAAPGLLHIHGGGFVMGVPEYEDVRNNQIAAELGHVVVSVDYRLAPEATYPSALDDCHAALLWLYDNSDALGIDRARIGLIGESAGGCHAAALSCLMSDRGDVPLAFLWLTYPMLDDRVGSTVTPHDYAGEFCWTAADNVSGWSAMLGRPAGGTPPGPYAVPARIEDLRGFPFTLMQTGALDLFCDEDIDFARRLMSAGVPTELHVYPGAVHGFPLAVKSAAAIAQLRDGFDALRRVLGGPSAS